MNRESDNTLNWLFGRINYERSAAMPYGSDQLKLDRMRDLLVRVGNPQDGLKIIHIAGTKGKGSTAAILGSVLTAAGYRTGLFTSPHLDRIEERLVIDGHACTAEVFIELVERVREAVEAMDAETAHGDAAEAGPGGPTFFEITTAMALVHFAAQQTTAAVLEVGLGGRLDSTNVCSPVLSIITNITLDHVQQLGPTLASIAREKAGIIKPSVPVVSGVMDPSARHVIHQQAHERGCRLVQLGDDFQFRYEPPRDVQLRSADGRVDFYLGDSSTPRHAGLLLGLLGRHQGENAAVAMAAIEQLREQGWSIPDAAIRQGLSRATLPARVEVVSRQPAVIVDAAHNVASSQALADVLAESFSRGVAGRGRRRLIFAASHDKDIAGMLRVLAPQFDELVLTRYETHPRAAPLDRLAEAARRVTTAPRHVFGNPADAWKFVQATLDRHDLAVITGSFFIAAEIRRLILQHPLGPFPASTATPGCTSVEKRDAER